MSTNKFGKRRNDKRFRKAIKRVPRYKWADREEKRQVGEIVLDVKKFLKNEGTFHTNQAIVGLKQLFRGIVVKKWIEHNERFIEHHECNKVLVKKCVNFYHKTWKLRCIEWHKEEHKVKVLRDQVKIMKDPEEIETVEGLYDYVNLHAIIEDTANCAELSKWIEGFRVFKKNAPKRIRQTLDSWLNVEVDE